jgi:hypothetical protein
MMQLTTTAFVLAARFLERHLYIVAEICGNASDYESKRVSLDQ